MPASGQGHPAGTASERPQGAARSLAPKYRPADHEPGVRERWERSGAFHAEPARVLSGERRPFSIFIPPPNVTARLHLGHALNNTLQDVLARVHRMRGHEVLWMPGTDHAGIATQTVVEQRILKEEGRRRTDFEREAFVARVQAWKDEYEEAITEQLKAIGCSCDWQRRRFTMDEVCARAVREAFFRLFNDGLIYRGKRLVNWDPATQTALADDEVEMEEVEGRFYYLRYPLAAGGGGARPVTWSELAARGFPGAHEQEGDRQAWLTVATTRPETYLGDTAVAVNPKDPRAAALDGLRCVLPLVGRVIPIVRDEFVVMPAADPDREGTDPKARYATGFLKVTPAHDPNDYEIGRRHGLETINVMAPDATISDRHGWTDVGDARLFVGLTREQAREKVVAEFRARGLLEKITPYRHAVGHSYRSHVPIEPYLSDQWYCRVTDERLRGWAQRALAPEQRTGRDHRPVKGAEGDGALTFHPARYARSYESWHENLRDWCISRQLWWGHRIPVWRAAAPASSPDAGLQALEAAMRSWSEQGRIHWLAPSAAHRAGVDADEPGAHFVCVRSQDDREVIDALERHGFTQDPDVLDTWFSSALWPLSTLGWPEPPEGMEGLPEAFNPSSVLCTAREIITLWVSRMVMFNRYFTGKPEDAPKSPGRVPFRRVYINPVVQDGHGQRMSKSLGNGVDPLDIVHSHGTDALRLVLCQMATGTQDVRMPVELVCPHCEKSFEPAWITSPAGYKVAAPEQRCPACGKPSASGYGVATGSVRPTDASPQARNGSTRFDAGRNFCTKLWNAARFALMHLDAEPSDDPAGAVALRDLSLPDRWILSRVARTVGAVNEALDEYHFSRYAELMYDLFWRDFCDWYLEAVKPTVKQSAPQRAVLHRTLDAVVRLLHPICPFITEEVFAALHAGRTPAVAGLRLAGGPLACVAGWPEADPALIDERAEAAFARMQALVEAVRQVRSAKGVEPRRRVLLHADDETARALGGWGGLAEALSGADLSGDPPPTGAAPFLFEGRPCALSNLTDEADPASERERLRETLSRLDKDIVALEGRLNNPGYAAKAPPRLVQETRDLLAQKCAERDTLRGRLQELA